MICDRVEYTRGSKGDVPANTEDEPSEKKLKPAKPMKEQTKIDWDDLPDSFEQAEDDIPF